MTPPETAPESLPPGKTFDFLTLFTTRDGHAVYITEIGEAGMEGWIGNNGPFFWSKSTGLNIGENDDGVRSLDLVNTPPPVPTAASEQDRPGQADAAVAEAAQWWLAELDQYGNPHLCDGAHSHRAGAEKALYIYRGIGLAGTRRYAIARVELTDAVPNDAGVNEESVALCAQALRASPEAALRATAPGEQCDGWLPIASAPRDGTWILGETDYRQVDYCKARWIQDTEPELRGWSDRKDCCVELQRWLPLPAPPTAAPSPPVDHAANGEKET